ncbi:acetyl-CoA carboxylase biotin carboxyl carrier protein subunit [Enterococcus faecalis]|uniref:acetyl-CoA carboxylase biotin carboxyl carrier protein subunit n=1 Tax=Enterococcus faecalis TaxID=1351 RepID=UPI0023311AE7|nr:acetyl-CoA carboxylase biotin carboxyl carrier protein subunit [Enterococcus faecalis]MDB1590383.1 acetyl-CoA carboxylase biotin carboxyl carrier protein subunit [Enterococcus faecalis]MDB1598103.1 acetyl-CoA carboxylase biotin carboxyl carrier protein subunit [Enterococcus faecalis]MDB1605985.1 acetyl-CoA carboxylase biotin carboxyl carrier protein subunit [Enterococcus faecalis]MDB1608539.1 acetyl-CoA carboxylase biotin carboxyl carrier protein subunit [Enterococcus faecalis]MDB1611017.1 
MLRKFKISIDGKEYLVEMEEIGGVPQPAPVAPQPTAPVAPQPTAPVATTETPAPDVEEAPAPAAQPAAPAGADAMPAPMPGTVLKVLVNVGDTVSENQPLLILEAMKMENEIVAGKAGTVTGIHVTQGQIVNPGEPLITIN